MTRVKGGVTTNRKHKKILNLAKGYWQSRGKQIKKAKEAVLHAGEYAFAGRKHRKRDMRSLWIVRLNAAVRQNDLTYSTFINLLKKKNIGLDRKVMARMALDVPQAFDAFIKHIKA
ncbi:MAG: 50S ribosomal protein L20 [Weeksellaceae bacterium]